MYFVFNLSSSTDLELCEVKDSGRDRSGLLGDCASHDVQAVPANSSAAKVGDEGVAVRPGRNVGRAQIEEGAEELVARGNAALAKRVRVDSGSAEARDVGEVARERASNKVGDS